ncbi:MAG: TetR/AcrR family transcriptional regulator C-terminal domain-containing protein [Clostridiales bacterium]|nr:TetR/AcrR family transcriptional regulator C-terminal domain-containing protein [Clostridiales bacterium]
MEDRRITNTKNALEAAFFRLLDHKTPKQISITELCNEAKINRSTFYAHYTGYEEFLGEMEYKAARKCVDCLAQYHYDMDAALAIDSIFTAIRQNKNLFYFIFREDPGSTGYMFVKEALREKTVSVWLHESDITPQQATLLYEYISGGSFAIMKCWYDSNFSIDESVVRDLFENAIKYGLYNYVYTK